MNEEDRIAERLGHGRQFRQRNIRHLRWGSLFFFGLITLVAYGTPSVAHGQHAAVRLLLSGLIGLGMTAVFAALGWMMVRGCQWGALLPTRIRRWWQRSR